MDSSLVFQLATQTLSIAEAEQLVAILKKKEQKTLNPISERERIKNEYRKLF